MIAGGRVVGARLTFERRDRLDDGDSSCRWSCEAASRDGSGSTASRLNSPSSATRETAHHRAGDMGFQGTAEGYIYLSDVPRVVKGSGLLRRCLWPVDSI